MCPVCVSSCLCAVLCSTVLCCGLWTKLFTVIERTVGACGVRGIPHPFRSSSWYLKDIYCFSILQVHSIGLKLIPFLYLQMLHGLSYAILLLKINEAEGERLIISNFVYIYSTTNSNQGRFFGSSKKAT